MWGNAWLIAARQAANGVSDVVNRRCGAAPGSSRGTTRIACFRHARRGFPGELALWGNARLIAARQAADMVIEVVN